MSNIYGYDDLTFINGLDTRDIEDLANTSTIDLSTANVIDLVSTNVKVNGVDIVTTATGITNPLTSNLNGGLFDITNVTNIEALTRTENAITGELLKKVSSTYYAGTGTNDKGLISSFLIGDSIGTDITSGTNNIIIGNNTCQDQADVLYNICIGNDAQKGGLLTPVTGIGRNVTIGQGSMQNIGGDSHSNTCLGYQAMFKSDGCNNCIAIGTKAFGGGSGTLVNKSCCLGAETRCAYINSIALGYNVWATKTNQCMIGDVSLTEIVPTASAVCDLGTTTNPFNNLQINSINNITPNGGLWLAIGAGSAITNSIVETNLIGSMASIGSLSVSANTFTVSSYNLNVSGSFASKNGDTITVRFYAGPAASTLLDTMVVPMVGTTGSSFELETDFDIQIIGTTGVAQIAINKELTYQDSGLSVIKGFRISTTNNTTFDTTVLNFLNVTVQYSAADIANSIQATRAVLTKIY